MDELIRKLVEKKIENRVFSSWSFFKKSVYTETEIKKFFEQDEVKAILDSGVNPVTLIRMYLNELRRAQEKLYENQQTVLFQALGHIQSTDKVKPFLTGRLMELADFLKSESRQEIPIVPFKQEDYKISLHGTRVTAPIAYTQQESLFIPVDLSDSSRYVLEPPETLRGLKKPSAILDKTFRELRNRFYFPDIAFVEKNFNNRLHLPQVFTATENVIIPGTFFRENDEVKLLTANFHLREIKIIGEQDIVLNQKMLLIRKK